MYIWISKRSGIPRERERERERETKAFVPSVIFAECFPSVKQHGPSVTHPSRILELADFPGGPVVKSVPSNAGGVGLFSGRRAKIPHPTYLEGKKPKHKTETVL